MLNGDGNENGKKTWKTNKTKTEKTLGGALHFFLYISFFTTTWNFLFTRFMEEML